MHSPHKISRNNKLRRYEESKQQQTQSYQDNIKELENTFSPINANKAIGIRMGLAKAVQG